MPNKDATWYVKTIILSVLLFLFTLLFGYLVNGYISRGDYFNLYSGEVVWVVLVLCVILLVYSLTVGSWNDRLEYIVVPLPISLGIFIFLVSFNIYNALYAFIIVYVFLCLEMYKTVRLKKMLVKFEPRFVLRSSGRGMMLVYSLFALFILMIGSTFENVHTIDVGSKLSDVVSDPISQLYNLSYLEVNVKELVTTQINNVVEPYRNFFRPVMAIFVFLIFRFFGSIAYALYSILIRVVFHIAKKTGFIKIEKASVEQEIPIF